MKLIAPLFFAIIIVFSSCGSIHIEKRHYRNGFYFARSNSEQQENQDQVKLQETHEQELSSTAPADSAELHQDSVIQESNYSQDLPTESNQEADAGTIQQNESQPTHVDQLPPDEDPVERQINITRILGILAIILVCIGLAGLEVTAFVFPLLLIGIGCAIFGLKFGKMALQNTTYRTKDRDGKSKPNEKRIRAKRAYWLPLSAILIVLGYVLIRFVIIAGLSTVPLAFTLLGICLALFLLFKLGVFSDLSD